MVKEDTPTVPSDPSDPSKVSVAAARLGPLLAGIRDRLRQAVDSAKSLADDEGVPFFLSADNIATAVLHLQDIGLPYDAKRLGAEYQQCRHWAGQQMLALLELGVDQPPDGMTEEEYRDFLTELFGPFPVNTLDDVRTMLAGAAVHLLQHVEELISTVGALFPTDGPTANEGKGGDPGRLTPEAQGILFVQGQIKATGKVPTKTAIAKALEVDRRTLNNWSAFKVAYEKLRSETRRQPARGSKSKDGTLEAWRESGK